MSIDAEQLAAVWTKNQRRVEAFILSLVPDYHQTDDILQNVAMVVVRKREEYDPAQPFINWALQIAQYEVLKHRRTIARDRHLFGEALIEKIAASHESVDLDLSDRRSALAECLQQVTGRSREALTLRYAENLKPAEVADRMGLGDGATRMMLHRSREVLRKCVRQHLAKSEESP